MQKNTVRLLILFALVYQLLLTGCSTSPSPLPLPLPTKQLEQTTEQRLQALYLLAKKSKGSASEKLRVKAADILSQQQRFEEAAGILKDISLQSLPSNVQAIYVIVQAEISLSRFDGKTTLKNLSQHSELILQQGQRIRLRSSLLHARSFELMEQHLDSARERIRLASMLTADQNVDNEAALWSALIKAPVEKLRRAAATSQSSVEQGWLSLALLKQINQSNMDRQLSALQRWLQRWPSHPAALNLPRELSLLDLIITERPNNVFLMLPLQGKNAVAGKAIRDGFMAAYYDAKAAGDYTPYIRIIDTTTNKNFRRLYDDVSLQGADFIIGPLEKTHVQTLQNSGSLTTPTLALNYGAEEISTEQLYQFGLSAEDESRQIAEKAWSSGHKNSLILAPESSWGQRISAAFSEKWLELGGTVLESVHFNTEKSYSSAIEELLDLDISKQRANRLSKLLARDVEFTARRRSDVDFIFVVATPTQARQIKPTLAFHFAGDIPVYATSHIYSGTPAPLLNADLNGIIFTETPWLLSHKKSLVKQAIAANWPAHTGRLGRLYALGVDAYQLYPRIQLLSTNQDTNLAGATGLLTLGDTGRVIRTLSWAHINRGHIEPLL